MLPLPERFELDRKIGHDKLQNNMVEKAGKLYPGNITTIFINQKLGVERDYSGRRLSIEVVERIEKQAGNPNLVVVVRDMKENAENMRGKKMSIGGGTEVR